MLLTWNDLIILAAKLPQEALDTPVLGQDGDTGEFFGYTGIGPVDEDEANPVGHYLMLESSDPYNG